MSLFHFQTIQALLKHFYLYLSLYTSAFNYMQALSLIFKHLPGTLIKYLKGFDLYSNNLTYI